MLHELKIGNYRAFGETQTVKFAVPNGNNGSGLTILVGPNNSGKTTLIEAIAMLFSDSDFEATREKRRGSSSLDLSATIDDRAITQQKLENSAPLKTISTNKKGANQTIYEVTPNSLHDKIDYISADRKFQDFIPDQFNLDQHLRMSETNRKLRLRGRQEQPTTVAEVKAKSENHLGKAGSNNINSLISQLLATESSIQSDKEIGQWVLTFQSLNHDHRLGQQGSGVQNIVSIANFFISEKSILLFDEPEVSLHPQAQKRLLDFLLEVSATRQIIIATHSPYLINYDVLKSGSVHRIAKGSCGDAHVKSISADTLRKIDKIVRSNLKNRKLYDVVSREVFFCDKGIIFCEGQEDVHYIENYLDLDESSPNVFLPLFGYGSGGSGNIVHWLTMAQELGIKAIGLYDGDEAENVTKANEMFDDDSIVILQISTADIRDKYECDAKGKKIRPHKILKEGIFEEDGKIKQALKIEFDTLLSTASRHLE